MGRYRHSTNLEFLLFWLPPFLLSQESTGVVMSDVRSQKLDYLSSVLCTLLSVLCWPAVGFSYIRADFGEPRPVLDGRGELSRAEQISQYTCP